MVVQTDLPDREARPLEGTTVLDLCMLGPGLYCTELLHRLGARVIHFEPPSGDPARSFPPAHRALNGGKESVIADLREAEGRALVLAAARNADVFVEGWRPGVADRLGIGPGVVREANPAIVYCSLSGYGQSGPLRERPGHDINYLAASGLMRVLSDGRPASDLPLPVGDIAGAYLAAVRILAALLRAAASRRGAYLDVSIAGAAREWVVGTGSAEGVPPTSLLRSLPHYGTFETLDGECLTLGITYEDHFWRKLCHVLDRPEWKSFSLEERAGRAIELRKEISAIVRSRSRQHWESALRGVDTCWAFLDEPAGAAGIETGVPPPSQSVAGLGEHTERLKRELVEHGGEGRETAR